MSIRTFLPVGTKENNKSLLIEKGDVVKLVTGEEVTFLKMNLKRFAASVNGKTINVPVWRDRAGTKPFITKKLDKKDDSVITESTDHRTFKQGQLFALEGHKQTFMFIGHRTARGGSIKVNAMDLASGTTTSITPNGFTFIKIDLNKIKNQLKG